MYADGTKFLTLSFTFSVFFQRDLLLFCTMTDIAPETSNVSLDRVVAAVETVSIDDKENLHSVEDETAAVAAAAAVAGEQNTPDCENEVNNASKEEEKQGWSFFWCCF
jgi:ribosomal protein L12E/L44/L45/RPP1/RPP2